MFPRIILIAQDILLVALLVAALGLTSFLWGLFCGLSYPQTPKPHSTYTLSIGGK